MYCNKRIILSMSAGGACRGCHPRCSSQALPLPPAAQAFRLSHAWTPSPVMQIDDERYTHTTYKTAAFPTLTYTWCFKLFAHAARRASHALLGSLAPGASRLSASTVWRRVCTIHEHFTLQRISSEHLQRTVLSLLAIACNGSQALARALKHSRCVTVGSKFQA